jgi:hypothetical protein
MYMCMFLSVYVCIKLLIGVNDYLAIHVWARGSLDHLKLKIYIYIYIHTYICIYMYMYMYICTYSWKFSTRTVNQKALRNTDYGNLWSSGSMVLYDLNCILHQIIKIWMDCDLVSYF